MAGPAHHNFVAFQSCEKQEHCILGEKSEEGLPSMIVFDLDDCLWTPEMHELSGKPSLPVEGPLDPLVENSPLGIIGMRVWSRRGMWDGEDGECVCLFDGARLVLRELALNPKYKGIMLAAASSSLEPSYSHACLHGIEVVPDLTLRDMFRFDQIGRTGELTPRKTTHFRELHKESGVPYEEMLFFDDCNWGDHCADVTRAYGVVSQRTPSGMTIEEFYQGLEKYRKESQKRGGHICDKKFS
jgi:magnesium-dependent phosphatase 1